MKHSYNIIIPVVVLLMIPAALPAMSADTAPGTTSPETVETPAASRPAVVTGNDIQADMGNASEDEEGQARIADPLEPFNRAMFQFNDKFYFWALKPVTRAYSSVVPEDFRFVFSNAYDNLKAPARVVNNLLQFKVRAAGRELFRFLFNSTAGIGGLADAAGRDLGIRKEEADFGQTLGSYGLGQGFYIVWPLLGPSSLRDTVGLVGDRLMYPFTYVNRDDLSYANQAEILAHEKVNDTSFKLGDYESFKKSALDPYVSMRDAFAQHRRKKVEEAGK